MNAEILAADHVLAVLSAHIGAERGIPIEVLVAELQTRNPGVLLHHRQVRRLVEQLRATGHHVCAHPETGYFMAETPEELDRTCEFLYERAMTSLRQVAAMRRISLPDLRGQLHLPT